MSQFLIDYKDGTRESIADHKAFAVRYDELRKCMDLVERFCSVDSNHISGLSSYGIRQVLLKGNEPEEGFIVVSSKGRYIGYASHHNGVTSKIRDAIILSKKDAEHKIIQFPVYDSILAMTKKKRELS